MAERVQIGPYLVDDGSRKVLEGHYEGEQVAACIPLQGTARIPGVQFSKEEAQKIQNLFNLGPDQFHLDQDAPKEGTYCIYTQNPAMNRFFVDHFDCSVLNPERESNWGWIPFVNSRCKNIKEALESHVVKEPGIPLLAFYTITGGAGFAVGIKLLDIVWKIAPGMPLVVPRDFFDPSLMSGKKQDNTL